MKEILEVEIEKRQVRTTTDVTRLLTLVEGE